MAILKKNNIRKTEPTSGLSCKRCGKCCGTNLVAYVVDQDLQRWNKEGRLDILNFLKKQAVVWAGDRLVSARGEMEDQTCPFLKRINALFSCAIYETRPNVCREYLPGSSALCPQYRS